MSDIKQITKNKGNKESPWNIPRGGSRVAATSKMERFVIIVNGLIPLFMDIYPHFYV